MKPIRFVYHAFGFDAGKPLLDALVDPVIAHLEGDVQKVELPEEGALNVQFWPACTYPDDVYFNHGIADKNFRNAEAVRSFGTICHSGPYWQRRYLNAGVHSSRLAQVGYTKLDPLFGLPQVRHTVLWAPTWSALWQAEYAELKALIDTLDVEQAVHCIDDPATVTLDPLVDADVVIADGGSTIYEAWALGKPVVFPDFAVLGSGLLSPGSLEAEIYERRIGYHVDRAEDLEDRIARARTDGITEAEVELIDDVFPPELRGTSAKAHAIALMERADAP